mmetsp:Transcript_45813/g.111038  ORF Transcript_45813/g.111038 Transcript_45813/m.111038 type:complete len:99 (+) Transcript_45813:715-1011(+)
MHQTQREIRQLRVGYAGAPVHKLCYQSSTTTVHELRQAIDNQRREQLVIVDEFGMTPFHVHCSTAEPRQDLLQLLLEKYPPYILGWRMQMTNAPWITW